MVAVILKEHVELTKNVLSVEDADIFAIIST
jgi:hypothetical protein